MEGVPCRDSQQSPPQTGGAAHTQNSSPSTVFNTPECLSGTTRVCVCVWEHKNSSLNKQHQVAAGRKCGGQTDEGEDAVAMETDGCS